MENNMRIIVTGAASGIGAAVVARALEAGVQVAALDLSTPAGHPAEVVPYRTCDVSDANSVDSAVSSITAEWGQAPNALVHCAGIYPQVPSLEIDPAAWDHAFAINVRGSMLLARAVARAALAAGHGASLVLLSSVAAERGEISEPAAAYAAGKGAVVSLARQLAVEWGPQGVRVNTVLPGVIDTPMTTVTKDPVATAKFLSTLPLQRLGSATDVANACWFLASEQSSFITGATLPVDGGFLAS